MIKINKPLSPPDILGLRYVANNHLHKGSLKWRVLERKAIRQYLNDPTPFINSTFAFSSDFGYGVMRDALESCQGPKCCYCEKPVAGGAIEHFRPKKAWQQSIGDPFNRPGYYWLAYRWENMLIACNECNQSGRKGNLFPVSGFRAINHTLNYETENNIIINPSEEDPINFISFVGATPVGIDNLGRGQENIKIFKLRDRADLFEIRNDRFTLYKELKKVSIKLPDLNHSANDIRDAKIYIGRAQSNKAPFSGMIRENIKKGLL